MRLIDADALENDLRSQFESVYKHIRDTVNSSDFYIERQAAYDKKLMEMEMEAFYQYLQGRPTFITETYEQENANLKQMLRNAQRHIEGLARERDAAVRDCARFPCYTCEEAQNGDFCPQCRTTGTFRTLHVWRGVCEENSPVSQEKN